MLTYVVSRLMDIVSLDLLYELACLVMVALICFFSALLMIFGHQCGVVHFGMSTLHLSLYFTNVFLLLPFPVKQKKEIYNKIQFFFSLKMYQ